MPSWLPATDIAKCLRCPAGAKDLDWCTWKRSWKIRRSHRKWAGAESSEWRTNFVSPRLPSHSVKYCAIYANPERDPVVRAVLRIWRTAGESGSAFQRIGKAGPPGDGTYGRLG